MTVTTSVQVALPAPQTIAFARLHRHLVDTGTISAAAESTVDDPHSVSYELRLRDGTSQVTSLVFLPSSDGCLMTMTVALEHEGGAGSGWITPHQLERQHRILAEAFARIAGNDE